jgi:hypothetical protein
MGNNTMSKIRDEFLAIRPQIFNQQRPFKFHMYPIAGLTRPDRYWTDGQRMSLRKCKHIVVSLDEVSEDPSHPISQADYHSHMTTFLQHLRNIIPDATFPIWIFSVNTHPSHSHNDCHSPMLPRTTDHPCNDVLRALLLPQSHAQPNNVHWLDNTDVTLPLWNINDDDASLQRNSVWAVLALRIYVLVGWGVEQWRASGQRGTVKGLERDGVVEPNFELVPYRGWS